MSIKVKIFSVVVLLTTLALGQAGFHFVDAQSSVNRNKALLTALQREALLLEMVALAGQEQMHVFSLLTSSKRLRKDSLEAVKTSIDERLAKFDALLDRLGAAGLTDETALSWNALQGHRTTAIEEAQKSAMVRDVKASRIWLDASSQTITTLAAEGIAAVPHELVIDPDTELYLVRIRVLSAASQSLAQYAALYSGLLSSRGHLNVELMREIAHLEGEFRHSIFEVFDGFVPIETAQGTTLTEEDFLNSPLNSLASQIVEHAVHGGDKPEGATTANWFKLSEMALTEITEAMEATKYALSLHVGETNKAAILERNISAAIVVSCLIAVAVSIWVVAGGVLRPLKRAVRHVDILADGDNSIDVSDLPDSNEFGQMRSALQKLVSMSRQVEVLNAKNAESDARQRELERKAAKEEADRFQREQDAAELEKRTLAEAQKAERAVAREIAGVVASCADGDFSKRLDIRDKTGVFKELCEGLNKIGEATSESLEEVREVLEHIATGDLTRRMTGSFNGTFASIADAMDQTTESLTETMEKIHKSAEEVENSAGVMAKQSDVLSTRSSDNASMLEKTSSSLTDINGSVSTVEGSAKIAMNAIEQIADQASAGKLVVSSAVTAMDEIKESSGSIAKILKVIEDIAFQTNLLALNAGVEAARAGDSGKGFAVVANEVRELAARSSEAGREISDLIKAATDNVEKGVSLVRNTGEELEKIAESVDDATGKISDIVNDSSESADKIREITSSLGELEKATQQNYDMVERSSQSVQSLREEASILFDSVDEFQLEKCKSVRKIA